MKQQYRVISRSSTAFPFQLQRGIPEDHVRWSWKQMRRVTETVVIWTDLTVHMKPEDAQKDIEKDIEIIQKYGVIPMPGAVIYSYDSQDLMVAKLKGFK